MKFTKGLIAGILLALAISAGAAIYGGVIAHNHSGGSSGGNTLQSTTLNNPTLNNANINATGITVGNNTDIATIFCAKGITSAVRIGATGTTGTIDGVDNTCVGSFHTLTISGSSISLLQQNTGTNVSVTSNGSLTSSKPCATNYTRIGPNFCLWTGALGSQSNVAVLGSCTGLAAPAGAIALYTKVSFSPAASNTLSIFNDASCTTNTRTIASSTVSSQETITPVVSGNSEFICSTSTNCTVTISGYFD